MYGKKTKGKKASKMPPKMQARMKAMKAKKATKPKAKTTRRKK